MEQATAVIVVAVVKTTLVMAVDAVGPSRVWRRKMGEKPETKE